MFAKHMLPVLTSPRGLIRGVGCWDGADEDTGGASRSCSKADVSGDEEFDVGAGLCDPPGIENPTTDDVGRAFVDRDIFDEDDDTGRRSEAHDFGAALTSVGGGVTDEDVSTLTSFEVASALGSLPGGGSVAADKDAAGATGVGSSITDFVAGSWASEREVLVETGLPFKEVPEGVSVEQAVSVTEASPLDGLRDASGSTLI